MDLQALVLTHEGASDTEKFPYLSVMLKPLQVLEFYGRCATRDPPCPKSEAVFHWWKDLGQFRNIFLVLYFSNFWIPLVLRTLACHT